MISRLGDPRRDTAQPSADMRRGLLWLGVLLWALSGCVPLSKRTVVCPDTHHGQTATEVLAELDSTGDGILDASDVDPGNSVLLFRFTQANGEERLVVSRDTHSSIIVHLYSGIEENPWGERSLFGTWHEFTECSASGWITLWFFNERQEDQELQTGRGELYHLAFDIAEIEHGNIGVDPDVDGWMHVVVQDGLASGHLEGSASTDIVSYFTQEPTGERAEVIAHAFNTLPF
jgi:hypothetical protein